MENLSVKKAIFPVGGLGTRFLPVTKSMPKEMLPIIDKPLILYAVEEALRAGIENFIFVTGRGKSAIEDFFDYSYELNIELEKRGKKEELDLINNFLLKPGQISYIRQQEPLGLGHAVWCARHLIGQEPFAVLLADDLILSKQPCLAQMKEAYQSLGSQGHLVALQKIELSQTQHYGIIDIDTQKETLIKAKGIIEKPSSFQAPSSLAVIGRYILDPSIFDFLSKSHAGIGGEIQLTDSIDFSLKNGIPLHGLLFEGKRFDCGSRIGLLEATIAFALERSELQEEMVHILKKYILDDKEKGV